MTAPCLDLFINITCQRFLSSYLEAEARKRDEIQIRMTDSLHMKSYVLTHMCQFVGYTRFAWAGGTCPRFAWAGGTFFPVVLLCQFLVLVGNRFWFYILLCTWSTIQLWCCVIFFGSGGKSFLVLRTGCAVVSVFGSGGK